MPETWLKFGEYGARIMIEKKEVPHYNIKVDPEKKEITCWIASEEGKVCEFLQRHLADLTNLDVFCGMGQNGRPIPNSL